MEVSQQILYQEDMAPQANRSGVLSLLTSVGIILSTMVFLLLALFGMECPFQYRMLVSFWILLNTTLCIAAWRGTKDKPLLRVVFSFVILHYQLAFVYKTVLMYLPRTESMIYWLGNPSRPSPDILGKVLVLGIIIVTGIYVSIILATKISKVDQVPAIPTYGVRLNFLAFLCIMFILLKYLVNVVLKWGLPGTEIVGAIPKVTGILVLFVRFGLFFLCSAYLYLSTVVQRDWKHAFIALIVTLFYLYIDFAIGSKFSLVYIAIILTFIVIEFYKTYRFLPKMTLLATIGFLTGVYFFYDLINSFRFARLRGEEMSFHNILSIVMRKEDGGVSIIAQLFNRVSGVDLFASAVSFSDFMKPSLINLLWSDDLRHEYTRALAGGVIAHHAIGFTQAGFMALLWRVNMIISFIATVCIITLLFTFFVWGTLRFIRSYELRKLAAIALGLFLLNLQFMGGGVLFFTKELFIMVVCIQIVDKLVFKRYTPEEAEAAY